MTQSIANAYDTAADAYRTRYDGIPPRTGDVDRALGYVTKENPLVVEIGCAYGREAAYIVTRTNRYQGIDISQQYINMARKEVPNGSFTCCDVMSYDWPDGTDVVFAFASLLHSPKEDVAVVLERISRSLNSGGVIFLSLKRRDQYETSVETDDLVSRRFYYYTRETILSISPPELVEVFYDEQSRQEEWFTSILQKQ